MLSEILVKEFNGYAGLTGITKQISVENLLEEFK
jgi:hypothetical protein